MVTKQEKEEQFKIYDSCPDLKNVLNIVKAFEDVKGITLKALLNDFGFGDTEFLNCTEAIKDSRFRNKVLELAKPCYDSESSILESYLRQSDRIQLYTDWISEFPLETFALIFDLITDNLQRGISRKKFLEHYLGKEEKFGVQLCEQIYEPDFKKLTYPIYCSQKFDGIRCVAKIEDGNVELFARSGKSLNSRFPEIVKHLENTYGKVKNGKYIFDGELCGKDFNAIQTRIGRKDITEGCESIVYNIFDLLPEIYGTDVIQSQRVEWLKDFGSDEVLHFISHSLLKNESEVIEAYNFAKSQNWEGIVLKDIDATWTPGSRKNWYKVKPAFTSDLVVVDVLKGEKSYADKYCRIVAEDKNKRVHVTMTSGLEKEQIEQITKEINEEGKEKYIGKIVEVKYQSVEKNSLRFPVFIGFRFDKSEPDGL